MNNNYVTLIELEEMLSQVSASNPNEVYRIFQASDFPGKKLRPLEEINKQLGAYVSEHPHEASSFRLEQYPQMFRGLVELVLLPENVDAWVDDREAYAGRSARDLLSVLDVKNSEENIQKVYGTFANAMGKVSVADFPSFDEFHYVVRLAQYEQLGLK